MTWATSFTNAYLSVLRGVYFSALFYRGTYKVMETNAVDVLEQLMFCCVLLP